MKAIYRGDRLSTSFFRKVSHRQRFSEVYLIDASSTATLDADFETIARVHGYGETAEEGRLWFCKERKKWLILFDNADDPSLPLQEYIPDSEHGTIFITTRNRDLCFLTSGNSHWELGPMTDFSIPLKDQFLPR